MTDKMEETPTPPTAETPTAPAPAATPAETSVPAPREINLPLGAECGFWEVGPSPGGKVILMLKQGGIDGKVIAWLAFEPTMIMRVMSALSGVASKLNPQLPRISFGG